MASNPIRLSHSTLEIFQTCERKFQIERLLQTDTVRDQSADLSLGTAYGVGAASYLVHRDPVKALYDTWLAYWPEIETEKKSVPHVIQCMIKTFPVLDNIMQDYEVLTIHGKPAVELSFRINLSPEYYYVGYIDFVLQNKYDKTCVVYDAKSTGLNLLDLSPLYQNSAQVLGYSIALDAMLGESLSHYSLGYLVAQLGKDYNIRVQNMVFQKTLLDRLNWLITLGTDLRRLEEYASLGFYPRRGSGCVKYGKACKHFGVCTLSSMDILREQEPDPIEYDFVFELDDLVNSHLERIGAL